MAKREYTVLQNIGSGPKPKHKVGATIELDDGSKETQRLLAAAAIALPEDLKKPAPKSSDNGEAEVKVAELEEALEAKAAEVEKAGEEVQAQAKRADEAEAKVAELEKQVKVSQDEVAALDKKLKAKQ